MSSGRNWQTGRDLGAHVPNMHPVLPPSPPLRATRDTSGAPWDFFFLFEEGHSWDFFYEGFASSPVRIPTQEEESRLAQEHKKVLKKLKIEIYNPMPKKISKRLNSYYRDPARISNNEEDDKRCAICLDDFEPKEEVTLTPCNHMFHEDCIVPWAKSHSQCPVCRFAL